MKTKQNFVMGLPYLKHPEKKAQKKFATLMNQRTTMTSSTMMTTMTKLITMTTMQND